MFLFLWNGGPHFAVVVDGGGGGAAAAVLFPAIRFRLGHSV